MEAQVGPTAPHHRILGKTDGGFFSSLTDKPYNALHSTSKGIFNTGVAFILMSWAVKRRGPIYPSMFNSLALVATVIMDSALLGTSIFLGR
jgi:hypothetical protein